VSKLAYVIGAVKQLRLRQTCALENSHNTTRNNPSLPDRCFVFLHWQGLIAGPVSSGQLLASEDVEAHTAQQVRHTTQLNGPPVEVIAVLLLLLVVLLLPCCWCALLSCHLLLLHCALWLRHAP
jgi:hypothetical protein